MFVFNFIACFPPSFLILRQVREYVTTSLWGGLAAVAPPRRLLNLAKFSPAYTDTLWYFQGGRPLPVSLTIDDAPGNFWSWIVTLNWHFWIANRDELIAGDPALMHEVLDLLKEAQIKVTLPNPPLVFMRSIQTSCRIHFWSGCSLRFYFSFEIYLIL